MKKKKCDRNCQQILTNVTKKLIQQIILKIYVEQFSLVYFKCNENLKVFSNTVV